MSAQHPTPWRAEGRDNGKRGRQRREVWAVLDRNEFFVAEGLDETTAREVVDAVNGRDSLLDLVRKMADNIARFHIVGERDRNLLREARAAVGEDED